LVPVCEFKTVSSIVIILVGNVTDTLKKYQN